VVINEIMYNQFRQTTTSIEIHNRSSGSGPERWGFVIGSTMLPTNATTTMPQAPTGWCEASDNLMDSQPDASNTFALQRLAGERRRTARLAAADYDLVGAARELEVLVSDLTYGRRKWGHGAMARAAAWS